MHGKFIVAQALSTLFDSGEHLVVHPENQTFYGDACFVAVKTDKDHIIFLAKLGVFPLGYFRGFLFVGHR